MYLFASSRWSNATQTGSGRGARGRGGGEGIGASRRSRFEEVGMLLSTSLYSCFVIAGNFNQE